MIDARRLHEWLGIGVAFNVWMSRRIEEYGFIKDTDFQSFLIKTGGRPKTDYLLTVNMAKELAMVERSKIGQLTRRYFIEMEQAAISMANPWRYRGTPEATFKAPLETPAFSKLTEEWSIKTHSRIRNHFSSSEIERRATFGNPIFP